MGYLQVVEVIAQPDCAVDLRDGESWVRATSHSGHVALRRDPSFRGMIRPDFTDSAAFFVPCATGRSEPLTAKPLVEVGVRSHLSLPEPRIVALGVQDARVDFVPDPRGGEQLWPTLTVVVWCSGLEALTLNYRVVLADG